MPGTGPALDHGGDAVAIRRVIVAHKSAAVAIRPAAETRRGHIASLPRFARIPFFGKFENLRTDVSRWGWNRSLLIRVISMLRRYAGLHLYRINVRPLVGPSPEPHLPIGIAVRIVPPEELLRAAGDPELDLSLDFVREFNGHVNRAGKRVSSLDSFVVLGTTRMRPHIEAMRQNISEALHLPLEQVSPIRLQALAVSAEPLLQQGA